MRRGRDQTDRVKDQVDHVKDQVNRAASRVRQRADRVDREMVQGRREADRVHRANVRVRRGPVQANRESVQGDRAPDGADRETDQVSLLSVGGRRVRVPEDRVLVQPDRAVGGLNRVPALAGQVSRAQSRSTGAVIRVCSPMMRDWTSRRRDRVGAKWYLCRAVWHGKSQDFCWPGVAFTPAALCIGHLERRSTMDVDGYVPGQRRSTVRPTSRPFCSVAQ